MQIPEYMLCWRAGCRENCLSGSERAGRKRTSARVQRAALPLYALIMLRNGVDIFALQKLMGHSDLQVLRRYLAQTDEDVHTAHMRGSPVDNNL